MGTEKTIMILGGGYYQLPLIEKSVELGYRTVVCGIPGPYPGYEKASQWYNVDTFAPDQVLEVARQEHIDGIVLCGSDAVMPTLGYVVDKMHLLGPSQASTIAASDKAVMKERFMKYGVRTAAYACIHSQEEALAFVQEHAYPVVLKVVDASGSKGVFIVHHQQQLEECYREAVTLTRKDYLVLEEFVAGQEFGAQSFVRNGQLTFVMPHGDLVFQGNTGVPVGHYAPFEGEEAIVADVTEQLMRCVKALGIDNTAINADFILHDGQVYVLEIGARAGATCLPELVSCYYNSNYYEYLLRQCVGEDMVLDKGERHDALVETLTCPVSGVLESVVLPDLPVEMQCCQVYPQPGDEVHQFRNAYDRTGHLVLTGGSLAHLRQVEHEFVSNIVWQVH